MDRIKRSVVLLGNEMRYKFDPPNLFPVAGPETQLTDTLVSVTDLAIIGNVAVAVEYTTCIVLTLQIAICSS